MIIHRDYRSASDSIVKVYDDRIEFYNPGRLPDSITVDDLLSNRYKSTPRNKLIADFCKSLGLIEKYGSGIRRVIEYFKDAELPQPDFRNISDGFLVTIYDKEMAKVGEKVGDRLTGNQIKIINLMISDSFVSAKDLSDRIGISVRKIETNISKLKELGYIKRVGPANGGCWEVEKRID
ncbi:ATP-binding protein [Natronoflexus pectinivorans]|nr:ATP-binding protein [Natronoflexus pectinivorans]